MTARKLPEARLKPAGHFSTEWQMVVEHGVTKDDIRHPSFYAHVARALRQGDEIKFISDDNTVWGRVLVLKTQHAAATVKVLQFVDLTETSDVVIAEDKDMKMSDFEIKWRGPVGKWSVVRKHDHEVIREGMATKEDAEKSCNEYLKALAA